MAHDTDREHQALVRISTMRCVNRPGNCLEDWKAANGGTVPRAEQERRWCPVCVAKVALGELKWEDQ